MKNILVFSIKGEVIGLQRHSETNVYSTGGGGYVGPNGGYVSAPEIRSSSTNIDEFFLKSDDGREIHVKLTNKDVPMRDGHRVSMIQAQNKTVKGGYWVAAVNHDTGRIHYIYSENTLIELGITKENIRFFSKFNLLILFFCYIACRAFYEFLLILDFEINFLAIPITIIGYIIGLKVFNFIRSESNNSKRNEFIKQIDLSY